MKRVVLSSESEFLFPLPARPAFHLFFGLWRRSSEFLFHSSHLLLLDFEFFFFLPPSLLCKPPTFFRSGGGGRRRGGGRASSMTGRRLRELTGLKRCVTAAEPRPRPKSVDQRRRRRRWDQGRVSGLRVEGGRAFFFVAQVPNQRVSHCSV